MDNQQRAERWLKTSARDRMRGAWLTALGHFAIAVAACVAWFGITWGLMFMFAMIITAIGISFTFIVYAVYALQAGLFIFVRRKATPCWEVSQDVDGEVVVIPPDNSQAGDYAYNQDHGFSFKRVYIALFFATPIALDEAWRELRDAMRISKMDHKPAAQLAAMLIEEQRKLTFVEVKQRWQGSGFDQAIEVAAKLEGFQLFSRDPQGVALTDSAINELLQE
jgi:hypothetical protein